MTYLLNTNGRFLDLMDYIEEPQFFLLCVLTFALLWLYMWWISRLVRLLFVLLSKMRPSFRWPMYGAYFLTVGLSITTFHLCLLHFLYSLVNSGIVASGYMRIGFPIFVTILFVYTSLVLWKPSCSVFHDSHIRRWWKKGRRAVQWKDRQLALSVGDMYGNGVAEQDNAHKIGHSSGSASKSVPSVVVEPVPLLDKVRILDILIYLSTRNGGVLYLMDGRVLYTKYTANVIASWLANEWFLKVGKGRYVNMFHLRRSKTSKYHLVAPPAAMNALCGAGNLDDRKLRKLLSVTEWFEGNLAQHEKARVNLPVDCWDEYFAY